MRIGLIGLGRIGSLHARTLAGLPAVESLVVHDPVAEVDLGQLGVEQTDSVPQLFAANLDGVVIAAPTDVHPELILAAVDAGIPVFCEKPVARAPADAVEVRRRVDQARIPVQIGYNRRFDPAFLAARAAVDSGELGWLHTVRSTTMDPAPPSAAYLAGSGGIFRDCSVHDFDIIRFVTGQEVVEVYATGSVRGSSVFAEIGDVATAAATLTLSGGALALVSNTRYNARGYDVRLEVHGSADSIAAGWDDRLPLRSVEPGAGFPAGPPHEFFLDRFAAAYRAELAAFLDVVAGARPSPCTVADALEAGWIAEACVRSLGEHRPVAVEEVRVPDGGGRR